MACCRIAVEVNACGRLHHVPKLHEARGHHHEVGQHVAFPEEGPECLKAIRRASARRHDLRKSGFAFLIPGPGVRESLNLTRGPAPVFFREQDIVIGIGVRGRIPVVVDDVIVVSTPGESVDVLVTDYGIAVNPRWQDLIAQMKAARVPLKTIEELRDLAYSITGRPRKPDFTDKIVALIEYRDGTLIDVLREVKPAH